MILTVTFMSSNQKKEPKVRNLESMAKTLEKHQKVIHAILEQREFSHGNDDSAAGFEVVMTERRIMLSFWLSLADLV